VGSLFRRALTGTLAGALLATSAVAVMPMTASADSGCVTRTEYRRVHHGYSMGRVHRIFGTRGKKVSEFSGYGYASQMREYDTCGSSWGFVFVSFDREYGTYRLSYKSAYWGS
jgi:hypothetical protein